MVKKPSPTKNTRYPGVYTRVSKNGDTTFYIRYRRSGRGSFEVKEPVGKVSTGMTAATKAGGQILNGVLLFVFRNQLIPAPVRRRIGLYDVVKLTAFYGAAISQLDEFIVSIKEFNGLGPFGMGGINDIAHSLTDEFMGIVESTC